MRDCVSVHEHRILNSAERYKIARTEILMHRNFVKLQLVALFSSRILSLVKFKIRGGGGGGGVSWSISEEKKKINVSYHLMSIRHGLHEIALPPFILGIELGGKSKMASVEFWIP